MSNSVLLDMQAPKGAPRSTFFETVTDPLLPPQQMGEMLAHFFEAIYDLSPESHLSRLLKILLGATGTGQLRKRYTYAHLSHFLLTMRYRDLDQMYAYIFGLKRFLREELGIDPYTEAATDEEWEAIDAADAAYRARVESFSHSLTMTGTPSGLVMAASAILGEEVRVYETYSFLDLEGSAYADSEEAAQKTYGDLEEFTYGELQGHTYAELEGTSVYQGRLVDSRGEFIIRPLRTISDEERLHLTRVLGRLKPAEALMTIDARPAEMHTRVPVFRAASTSSYWHIQQRVQIAAEDADLYDRYEESEPVQQPRQALSAYQGEAWSYNADVINVSSYIEDEEGAVIQPVNFERSVDEQGQTYDYTPEQALMDPASILMGRYVSDGVLTAPVAVREGA